MHGGLCAAHVPGQQDGVQQHVRAADHQRSVYGQHTSGQQAHEVQGARFAQPLGGLCTKVRKGMLDIVTVMLKVIESSD